MFDFLIAYKVPLVKSLILFIFFLILRSIFRFSIYKLGRKTGINDARNRLISRYVTGTLLLIFLVIEAFIFGRDFKELTIIFSSVFTVIGIGLFAIWSILSNITSGMIKIFL
jgi:MscS family membrane protein